MKTISIVCEKGGTGKTTLSVELLRNLQRHGVKTSLYSLDGQYREPSWSVREEDADVAVVDTPGVLADNLKDIIEGTDVFIVPVRPTPNDIEPFTRTVDIIRTLSDKPLIIVVNGYNRWKMCDSFMEWLSKKDWADTVLTVPQSEAIVKTQALGKSVCKVDSGGKAAKSIEKLSRVACKAADVKLPAKPKHHKKAKAKNKDKGSSHKGAKHK